MVRTLRISVGSTRPIGRAPQSYEIAGSALQCRRRLQESPVIRGRSLIVLLFTLPCFARPARASVDAVVAGVVEDALLHPLADATVLLHDTAGRTVAKTVTGPDGRVAVSRVPVGGYSIRAPFA